MESKVALVIIPNMYPYFQLNSQIILSLFNVEVFSKKKLIVLFKSNIMPCNLMHHLQL